MFLTIVTFLPALGALVLALRRTDDPEAIRRTALWWSLLTFAFAVSLFWTFNPNDAGIQFPIDVSWIPEAGVSYHLGVDGISLLLVLLTTLLVPLLLWAPWDRVRERYKAFAIMVLLLETALIGVFLALDLVLFYVFWEAMLIPTYFLIGIWGGERRGYAAIKFFLYTMATSVLMLVAIIALYTATGTFSWTELRTMSLDPTLGFWAYLAFVAAFAVKVPIWPLHSWLPDAYSEAPITGTILLSALMSKAGLYGLIRFGPSVFPDAAATLAPYLLVLALIGVVYGAFVAMAQRDLKRLVAYSSVSHLGLVAVGIFSFGVLSTAGSVIQMANHGVYIAALFLVIAILMNRFDSRSLDEMEGVASVMPRFAALFLIILFASVALPGTNGFVGEFLILVGTYLSQHPIYAIVGASIAVLSAIYMLYMARRVFHGPVAERVRAGARDLSGGEAALLAPFVALILWIGIYPAPFLSRIEPTVQATVEQVQARLELNDEQTITVHPGSDSQSSDAPASEDDMDTDDAGGRP